MGIFYGRANKLSKVNRFQKNAFPKKIERIERAVKKIITMLVAAAMAFSVTACSQESSQTDSSTNSTGTSAKAKIYYLNFKPEIAEVYEEIAKAYQQETGVELTVVTAAAGGYEQTLKSEIAKAEPPTIFQINGPRGYAGWKEYCADLKDTQLYQHLTDKSLAITDGDGVYGIPNVVEGYGIIYNDAIMQRYFSTPGAKVSSMEEIRSFETLKEVVEDMTAKKEELGIQGVFASTSLSPGEDWRWHTHLANIPLYYEFTENDIDLSGDGVNTISLQYSRQLQNIFDLYLNNSVTEPKLLGSKQVADSMAEFALGQCAMVQNGNWAYSQISQVDGNTVQAEDIKFLPIYTGIAGEEDQGICIGTENYLAINRKVSQEKQQLSADFLYWLYSSETGKDFVVNRLGFIAPFDTFTPSEQPDDPLAQEVIRWMNTEGVRNIPWDFTIFPNQAFKDDFGAALLQYAQGSKDWDQVTQTVVTRWTEEFGS